MARTLIRQLDHIVPMDGPLPGGSDASIGPGDIWIEDDRIAAIVPASASERPAPGSADTVIDGVGRVAFPGLVNTHHHFFQILTRNVAPLQEAELFDWLVGHYSIWRGYSGEMVDVSSRVALGELLLTGCTTTTDHHYLFPSGAPRDLIDRQVAAASELGIRFHPTRGSMEMGASHGGLPPDNLVEHVDDVIDDCRRLIDTVHDPSPRSMCRLALAPCAPFNVSEELMRQTAALARSHDLRLHTHLGETHDEIAYCLKEFGIRPLEYAKRLGWLESNVWFAHAVTFDEHEIREMGRVGVGVAHCPSSNLRLGSGVAPVRAMLEAGVPVGIGVDGSASNDSSNLLAELHQSLLAHRTGARESWLTATEILAIATRGGARVLGRDDIGSLRVGMAADLFLVNVDQVGYAGSQSDPVAAVVFNLPLRPVDLTMVNGRIVVQGGELVAADERALARHAHALSADLLARATRPS